MAVSLAGRRITLSPLTGESEFAQDLEGNVEGMVHRPGVRQSWDYHVVRLRETLEYRHPELRRTLRIDRVLVLPDGTMLEWAFLGGGPPGLPVLTKVFGVIPSSGSETDYVHGEIFLLAR